MNKKLLIVGLAVVVLVVLFIIVILPAITVSSAVSYKLSYQGYSFAKSTGTAADGQPILEASSSAFTRGERVYFMIYGISGLNTTNGEASIKLSIRATGQGKDVSSELGPGDYPAEGGVIDNIYGFIDTADYTPGRYSLSVTLSDLLSGGFVTAQGEFLVQ